MKRFVLVVAIAVVLGAGCGKQSPDELLKKAQAAEQARDFPLALETYGKIVQAYPQSAVAETSMFVMATIHQNETHDHQKAIDLYKQYTAAYPGSSRTPGAMFLVGFIYNNELHNYDSAAAAYRRFLERFPRDPMAKDAQFELDSLGKSPEQLLPPTVTQEGPAKSLAVKKGGVKSAKH
jgi:outer membrane protein assembly factor BamD (BamD/ComL family)